LPSKFTPAEEDKIISDLDRLDRRRELQELRHLEEALETAEFNLKENEQAVDLARHRLLWDEEREASRARYWFWLSSSR
jgi:hypothetical protein